MKLWYKKTLVFVVAGLAYGTGLFFSAPEKFGFCNDTQSVSYICRVPGAVNIGWPLTSLGQALAVVAIIMLFANERSWRTWFRFSVWFVPLIALIVIFVFPLPFAPGYALPRDGAVNAFGHLYEIVTFFIVVISWLHIWHQRRLGKV